MKSKRTTALIASIAIVASACGGSNATDTAEAERIAELEAQVEELAAQAAQSDSTTTAPPKDTPEASVVVATTAPPTEEAEAPTETEAPDDTEPEAEPPQDDAEDAGASSENPPAPEGFAAPNGTAITATSSANEMVAIIKDVTGPTDDLPGTFARVGRFPMVSTMPDTSIIDLIYNVQNDYVWGSSPGGHRLTATVQFSTSALPEDVVLAYQTELAAKGYGDISTGEQNQDDITFYTLRLGEYGTGVWDVVAWTRDGVNYAELQYVVSNDEPMPEVVDAVSGFIDGAPVPEGADLDQVALRVFATGTIKLDAQHNMAGVEVDTVTATHDERIGESDWVFTEMFASSFRFDSPAEAGEWSMRYDEFDTTSTNTENTVRTIIYTSYEGPRS